MAAFIRIATPEDAPAIQAIYAPVVENTIISFETEPPTVAEMAGRIQKTLEFFPYLVCESNGAVIGYVYATKHRERAAYQWAVDVTAYIREDYRGKGVGKALYTALKGMLAGQGFYHAYAGIALPNAASVGLHEAVGFKPLGVYQQVGFKLDGWHDVGWWELQLQPLDLPPRPLQPFPEFIKTAGAGTALQEGTALLRL
ncbi:MAG: N-acetyltransferase [Chloroflexi bacterium]|nr:N-acetyltransferase [Chloroflexota bacterium]OJW06491.1 MAG: GNAT family N-acetyltransferase [Chloroflexi bacterium 54-19]